MTYRVERFDARERPDEQLEPLFGDAFPPFITADPVAKVYIDRVRAWFGEFDIMLVALRDPERTEHPLRRPGAGPRNLRRGQRLGAPSLVVPY
jgi:hypothetical protein